MTTEEAKKVIYEMICLYLSTPKEDEALHIAYQALEQPERKKGKWEYVDDVDYRCSVCHKYAYGCLGEVLSGQYKYCPYCGCAMEGAKEQ